MIFNLPLLLIHVAVSKLVLDIESLTSLASSSPVSKEVATFLRTDAGTKRQNKLLIYF